MSDGKTPTYIQALENPGWPDTAQLYQATMRFPNGTDLGTWRSRVDSETREYTRTDLVRAQIEAAVKRALEGAADCLRELASRFDYNLDDEVRAVRQLDPAQFVDGAEE